MRYKEILEYKTKSGQDITFKYLEDVEGDNNRGWIIHQINAFVDNIPAGYISISYVSKERFKRYYPTVLNYMSHIGGWQALPYGKHNLHYKELSDDDLKETIRNISYRIRKYHDFWNTGEGIPNSREEMIFIIEDIIKNHLQDNRRQFIKFRNYFVDKPIVGYIRVLKKDDELKKLNPKNRAKKDFRRQHIGLAIYLEAADWLSKKGLRLYASTLQSDEASAAWKKLEKMERVAKIGKRRFIKI